MNKVTTRAYPMIGGVVIAVAAACMLGCTPSSSPEPTAAPETTSTPPPPPVAPLTGVPVESALTTPAVSVKIPADNGARPQTGLVDADNVWVELVEGGEVRYDAVYHSTLPENVGPVRSVRPVDALINAPLHGVLLVSGGQPDFLHQVGDAVGSLLTEDSAGAATWRTKDRRIPYNLYASPKALAEAATGLAAPEAQWPFGEAPSGDRADSFTVRYPAWTSKWTWSGSAWQRGDNGKDTSDADGRRVEATTVLVLAVGTHETSYRDPVGAPVVDTDFVGSGEARIASGGTVTAATWSKASATDPVTLTDAQGQPLTIAPGKIWIELVPGEGSWFTQTPEPTASHD